MLKIGDTVKTTDRYNNHPIINTKPIEKGIITDIEIKDPGKYEYHIATVKVKRSTRKINIEALELINQ